jgi:hypothetical protein
MKARLPPNTKNAARMRPRARSTAALLCSSGSEDGAGSIGRGVRSLSRIVPNGGRALVVWNYNSLALDHTGRSVIVPMQMR